MWLQLYWHFEWAIVTWHTYYLDKKGKVLPYSWPSVGPGIDPSVQAVGYSHYFPPGLRSPSQLKNVTVLRPLPSYTAWRQRHIGVNNLPKVFTQLCPSGNWTHNLLISSPVPYFYATVPPIWLQLSRWELNPWPIDLKSNALLLR